MRSVVVPLVAGFLTLIALAGCGDLEEAAAAGSAPDALAADMATQLSNSATLSYTAGYQLAGGEKATVSQEQKPARSAYTFPGGKIIFDHDATARCTAKTCTLTAPPTATEPLPAEALTELSAAGMLLPDTAVSLLNAAASQPGSTTPLHDTTVAGHHATCLQVDGLSAAQASSFTICVTTEGVLGSFTGTLSATTTGPSAGPASSPTADSPSPGSPATAASSTAPGPPQRLEIAMTSYDTDPPAGAFAQPSGVTTIDKR